MTSTPRDDNSGWGYIIQSVRCYYTGNGIFKLKDFKVQFEYLLCQEQINLRKLKAENSISGVSALVEPKDNKGWI